MSSPKGSLPLGSLAPGEGITTAPALPFDHRLLRRRLAMPLIVAAAVLGLVSNEVTYGSTADALRLGTALTEARIAAAGVLQLLTDAETGQRGFLLTGRSEYLSPLTAAKLEVPRMRTTVAAFLEASGTDGHAASLRMAQDIQETLAEIERTVNLAQAGDRRAALEIIEAGRGRRRMDDMRNIFSVSLLEAAGRQQASRVSLDDSLHTNRLAVAALVLLGAIALALRVRHLRQFDQERASRHAELEAQVEARTGELRQLAGYLLTAREDEKAHLARELHDEMGAVLTAAKLDVARMRRAAQGDDRMLARLEQLNERLNEGIAIKRRVVEDLRPSSLDTLGLTSSLANLCSDATSRLGVPVHTDLDDVPLSEDGQLAAYRLVQEALTNIAKYAQATEVRVQLKVESGRVRVLVADNGKGFDVGQLKATTHGIAGMRFRIERLDGCMTVESEPGQGTRIQASLPAAGHSVPQDN